MKIYLLLALTIVLSACDEPEKSESSLLTEIQQIEDSLKKITGDHAIDEKLFREMQLRCAEKHIALYQTFPDSKNAAASLDKVQNFYSSMENYSLAAQWTDTLINKYPKYKNRALVLESQALAYDAFIQPRDSSAVRLYYSMLLNEFPGMDKEKRKGIKRRLEHNALNFEEYIEFQMMHP